MVEQFLLIGLAAWRLSSLLIDEEGPFGIFTRIRYLAGIKEGPIEGFFPTLFSCFYCMGFWTSVSCYFAWQLEPAIIMVIAAWALSIFAWRFMSSPG